MTVIGLVISVLSVGGVVYWASGQEAPDLPDSPGQLAALAGAIALYALNTVIRAERWHALLHEAGATPSRTDTYALTVIGYTGNNVLPARAGDAVRVVLLAPRAATTKRAVVGTLLAERLLDIAVIAVLFVVVGYAALGDVLHGDARLLAAIALAGLLAAAAAFLLARRSDRARELIQPILSSTLGLRGPHGGAMLAVTVLIWLVEAGVWWTVAAAVELHMNPREALYLVTLASVFALIPSGPAYAGTQDAAVAIGVRSVGGSGSITVAYMAMLRFVLIVPITALGFLLLAVRYGGISRLRAGRVQTADA